MDNYPRGIFLQALILITGIVAAMIYAVMAAVNDQYGLAAIAFAIIAHAATQKG